MTARDRLTATLAELHLSLTAEFIPFRQSRDAGKPLPTLNWRVTVAHKGRAVLTVEYGAGCAHCPSYKQGGRGIVRDALIRFECEHGKPARWVDDANGISGARQASAKPIMPDPCDVFSSLALDASAIDSGTFEDWAGEIGYDTDSRSAERIYQQCLETALKLRAAIGEDGLAKLREAASDY